jgi:hypothetical protein
MVPQDPPPRLDSLPDKLEKMALDYKADAKSRERYKAKLVKELKNKRSKAAQFQKLYDTQVKFDTNLNPTEEGAGGEQNDGEKPSDDIADTDSVKKNLEFEK